MKRMFLDAVEGGAPEGAYAQSIRALESMGVPVPGIMRLFAYKPEHTQHLARYTQAVMRGPSPLTPGFRELIAAYTSKLNHCPF
jgi:alkylhydroperoxidase family enzyme